MSESSDIVITSVGAITPVGSTVEQSCAAIRAGINRITEHAYFECRPHDPEWDEELPLFSSSIPSIDPFIDGFDRLVELAVPSLSEAVENAKLKRQDIQQAALLVSLPQSDAATGKIGLATNFVPAICKRTGLTEFKTTKINQSGRTGMFEHIANAIALLKSGEYNFCIVGGVDSYLLEDRLDLLDAAWRIRSDRNIDGFIPGEASVMLVLETETHAKTRGIIPISKINAIASGEEPETISSEKSSTGSGLTDAITGVLQQTNNESGYKNVYCSLNGESYYAFEWGIQLSRINNAFENMSNLVHPAENCGDIGAATGGLLIACATKAFEHGYNEGKQSLLWASADSGHRMALCLQQA